MEKIRSKQNSFSLILSKTMQEQTYVTCNNTNSIEVTSVRLDEHDPKNHPAQG